MTIRSVLALAPALFLSTILAATMACPDADGADDDDGGEEGEGEEGEGEGEGEGEEGEGEEGEEGEGEGDEVGNYTGAAEAGAVCGDAVCPVGQACCVNEENAALVGTCSGGAQCDPGAVVVAACDGAEDCAEGEECCIDDGAFCVAEGACADTTAGSIVCIDDGECGGDVCCALDIGVPLPLDMGVCADSC